MLFKGVALIKHNILLAFIVASRESQKRNFRLLLPLTSGSLMACVLRGHASYTSICNLLLFVQSLPWVPIQQMKQTSTRDSPAWMNLCRDQGRLRLTILSMTSCLITGRDTDAAGTTRHESLPPDHHSPPLLLVTASGWCWRWRSELYWC